MTFDVFLLRADELRQAFDRPEMQLDVIRDGFYRQAKGLSQSDPKFERVDRVQPKSFDEEELIAGDVFRLYVLELQTLDDQPLDARFQFVHSPVHSRNMP